MTLETIEPSDATGKADQTTPRHVEGICERDDDTDGGRGVYPYIRDGGISFFRRRAARDLAHRHEQV